jgi:hypothetical protein
MTASGAFESISGSGDDFAQVVAACESLRDYCLIGGLAINELDLIRIAERYPQFVPVLPKAIRDQLGESA